MRSVNCMCVWWKKDSESKCKTYVIFTEKNSADSVTCMLAFHLFYIQIKKYDRSVCIYVIMHAND